MPHLLVEMNHFVRFLYSKDVGYVLDDIIVHVVTECLTTVKNTSCSTRSNGKPIPVPLMFNTSAKRIMCQNPELMLQPPAPP